MPALKDKLKGEWQLSTEIMRKKYSLQRMEQRLKATVCMLCLLLNAKPLQRLLPVVSKAPNGPRLALGLQAITS